MLGWVYAFEKSSEKGFGSPMARGADGRSSWIYVHTLIARHDPWNWGLRFLGRESWMVREQFAKADIGSVLERLSEQWKRSESEKVVDEEFTSGQEQKSSRGQGTGYIRVDREVA